MNLKKYTLMVSCLCLVICTGDVVGKMNQETSSEVSHIAKIIEKASEPFGYELIRGYLTSDEWEVEERKMLVDSHAYYTLFGKDSDDSCLSTTGRIGVTVLVFKDAEIARNHIAQRKEHHLGNMLVKIIKSNEDGFLLEDFNGFYAAVIRGSKVILFEDRSGAQREVIGSVADTLAKEPR